MTAKQFSIEYQKGFGRTFALLRSRGFAIATCEDIAQEAWMKAWAKRDSFRGESSFLTWVFSITFRLVLKTFRDQKYFVELENLALPNLVNRIDAAVDVEKIMSRLSKNITLLLRLRYIEGYHGVELAACVGITDAAMKTRLHRAVQAGRLCVKR